MFGHNMKTWESDERRGEAETFISFECLQNMIKHVEGVFHMTSQTHGQTRQQVFGFDCGTHYLNGNGHLSLRRRPNCPQTRGSTK